MSGLAIASSNGIDEKIVSVGVSYSTNVPAGTSVPMEWDTYIIDELAGAAFDVVNFWTRLTVPPGYTRAKLTAGVNWEVSTAIGTRKIELYRNGLAVYNPSGMPTGSILPGQTDYQAGASGVHPQMFSSCWLPVTAGNYFEVMLLNSSTLSNFVANDLTFFEMILRK